MLIKKMFKLKKLTEKGPNLFWLSLITFIGIFLFALGIIASERLIPIFEKNLALKHWESGAIISSALIGFLIAMLSGGILSDFISRKYLILLGFLLLVPGTVLFGFSVTYIFLLIGNLLIGISGGFLEGLLSLVIMDMFKKKKGMALNLSQVFFGLGAASSPFLVMAFNKWKFFYLLIAITSFLTLLISLTQRFPDSEDIKEANLETNKNVFKTLTNKKFFLTVLAMVFYSCTETGITAWISVFFLKHYGTTAFVATLSLSSYWGAQLVGRSTIGLFVDRFKNENFISLLFFISAFFIIFSLSFDNLLISYILFTLSGLSMAPLWPTILSKARERFTMYPGSAFGVIASFGAGVSILMPPLIGRIADITLSIQIALYSTACTSLLGGIIYFNLVSLAKTREKT